MWLAWETDREAVSKGNKGRKAEGELEKQAQANL